MSDHPNAAIMRTSLEAFIAGDMATMLEHLDEGVVWHAPGTNRFSGRFDGKGAVVERFRRMAEAGIVTTLEIHDVVGNDEHALAMVNAKVTGADGRTLEGPQVQVVHIRDGRAVDFWAMNQDQAALDVVIGT